MAFDKEEDDRQWLAMQEQRKLWMAVADAMNDLPIISRLEFVKNVILDRSIFGRGDSGSKDCSPQDPVLTLAHDVLSDVIDVLKKHPRAARLRTPEP